MKNLTVLINIHYVHEYCPLVLDWKKVKLESSVVMVGNQLPNNPDFNNFLRLDEML